MTTTDFEIDHCNLTRTQLVAMTSEEVVRRLEHSAAVITDNVDGEGNVEVRITMPWTAHDGARYVLAVSHRFSQELIDTVNSEPFGFEYLAWDAPHHYEIQQWCPGVLC